MNISVNRLLNKIGAELTEAKKAGSEAKIRERAQAIKAICELILDESTVSSTSTSLNVPNQSIQSTQSHRVEVVQMGQPVGVGTMLPQQKPLPIDEANGESLFDF
jgi:hypothetical protein